MIKKLKGMIGHAVEISFVDAEPALRKTEGILEEVTEEYIRVTLHNNFGEGFAYYLNCHACQIITIVDYGELPK